MTMRLLTTFVQKEKQQEELTRKILRIQETEELETKTNFKLARAQIEFNESMARNQAKWALEEQEHTERIKDMTKEIEALESRKQQALIPLELYKKEADKLLLEAQEIIQKSKEKEEQADYLQEKLENKLSEVSDRENVVLDTEKLLEVAKRGVENQQEFIKKSSEELSKQMIVFHEKQKLEEASLLKRKEEVAMAEISLNAKLEKYARDLEALKIWDIQLKDEWETLEREKTRRSK